MRLYKKVKKGAKTASPIKSKQNCENTENVRRVFYGHSKKYNTDVFCDLHMDALDYIEKHELFKGFYRSSNKKKMFLVYLISNKGLYSTNGCDMPISCIAKILDISTYSVSKYLNHLTKLGILENTNSSYSVGKYAKKYKCISLDLREAHEKIVFPNASQAMKKKFKTANNLLIQKPLRKLAWDSVRDLIEEVKDCKYLSKFIPSDKEIRRRSRRLKRGKFFNINKSEKLPLIDYPVTKPREKGEMYTSTKGDGFWRAPNVTAFLYNNDRKYKLFVDNAVTSKPEMVEAFRLVRKPQSSYMSNSDSWEKIDKNKYLHALEISKALDRHHKTSTPWYLEEGSVYDIGYMYCREDAISLMPNWDTKMTNLDLPYSYFAKMDIFVDNERYLRREIIAKCGGVLFELAKAYRAYDDDFLRDIKENLDLLMYLNFVYHFDSIREVRVLGLRENPRNEGYKERHILWKLLYMYNKVHSGMKRLTKTYSRKKCYSNTIRFVFRITRILFTRTVRYNSDPDWAAKFLNIKLKNYVIRIFNDNNLKNKVEKLWYKQEQGLHENWNNALW